MIPDKNSVEYKIRKFRQAVIREKSQTDKIDFKFQEALNNEFFENRKKYESEVEIIKRGQNIELRKIYLKNKIRETSKILEELQNSLKAIM